MVEVGLNMVFCKGILGNKLETSILLNVNCVNAPQQKTQYLNKLNIEENVDINSAVTDKVCFPFIKG